MSEFRAFSYGGGVQSTAALVLAAHREIDFPLFLFANTGDDSEHPATLAYVRHIAIPYARQGAIELLELQKRRHDGSLDSLYGLLTRRQSLGIPLRGSDGGPVGFRSCTPDFKIRVIARELRRRGATAAAPALVGLGITLDEVERASSRTQESCQVICYPLLDLGLTRQDCLNVITDEGLPVPPKSACYFCPFHSRDAWERLRRDEPDLFERAAQLEEALSARTLAAGKGQVFLTRYKLPLREAISPYAQLTLDHEVGCESGYCMT